MKSIKSFKVHVVKLIFKNYIRGPIVKMIEGNESSLKLKIYE